MEQNTPNQTPLLSQSNAITTIVELLFGEQMRSYETQFRSMGALVKENQDKSNDKINQTQQDLMAALQQLENRLSEQIKRNHEETMKQMRALDDKKLDRNHLGSMLIEIGKQIMD